MTLEKIIKDERGTLKIEVSLWITKHSWETDINGNSFRYNVHTSLTLPKKRKPECGNFTNLLSEKELVDVKNEYWLKLKP